MNVYFDNAATTPLDQEVLSKMLPYMEEGLVTPHQFTKRAEKLRQQLKNLEVKLLISSLVNLEKFFLPLAGPRLIICS